MSSSSLKRVTYKLFPNKSYKSCVCVCVREREREREREKERERERERELAINNLQGSIYHKTQANQPFWYFDWFEMLCLLQNLYEDRTISFQTFFVWAFEIVVDSWKCTMLLLYILWPIFMILGSNEQLHHELEYTLLKPDCHSWWISKMQSNTLEERYAIKFCFKLGKNATECHVWNASDCFLTILHESSISFWVA